MIIEPRSKCSFQAPSGAACATVNGIDQDMPLLRSFREATVRPQFAPDEIPGRRGHHRDGTRQVVTLLSALLNCERLHLEMRRLPETSAT